MHDYRITDIEHVHLHGRPVTVFRFYRKRGEIYVHAGQFTAPGWQYTEAELAGFARHRLEDEEDAP